MEGGGAPIFNGLDAEVTLTPSYWVNGLDRSYFRPRPLTAGVSCMLQPAPTGMELTQRVSLLLNAFMTS